MAENSQDNNLQDDQVLAKLYKDGAKDSPPAKLNSEILNYAAKARKPGTEQSAVGSHFGGGWKVPLSLAASIVVVFGLLVQLDQTQTHDTLELPPIPEINVPKDSKEDLLKSAPVLEEKNEADSIMLDEAASPNQDDTTLNADTPVENKGEQENAVQDLIIPEISPELSREEQPTAPVKREAPKKLEQKQQIERVRTYEAPIENTEPTTTSKTKSVDGYAPKLAKPPSIEKQTQEPKGASAGMQEESVIQQNSSPSREDTVGTSDIAAERDSALESSSESEFAPLPVEDWLLMIEKLVARKDYAEAARQLQKFKQAHPKVNVEDLEAKIP